MLKIENLSKNYRQKMVLNSIKLDIKEKQIYGLLGRNGAGKTTLLKIIANQISHQGDLWLNGELISDSTDLTGKIIFAGGGISRDNGLLAGRLENTLAVYDALIDNFDLGYSQRLCQKFKLDLKDKYKNLSAGNKTLFEMVLGLASRASLTLLDEPASGLDTVNRYILYNEIMEDWQKHPRTILLSTHIISEIEDYLTQVIFLGEGKIKLNASLDEVHTRAQIVENVQPDCLILDTKEFAGRTSYLIYNQLPDKEVERITSQGGTISQLPLDQLFVAMLGGEGHNENI